MDPRPESLSTSENTPAAPKKVFIETWGCQMNVADSEAMLGMLEARSYEMTMVAEEADLVLLNTCHIREKATHKVLTRLGTLRPLVEKNPALKIAVTGCVAQAEGAKLFDKADNIDILIGPGKIAELPQLLDAHDASRGQAPVMALGFDRHREDKADEPTAPVSVKPTVSGKSEITRYVNIAQGCDNFCTFCVVPFTRGRELSRRPDEILAEVQAMVNEGCKEITLLGQNVNSYGLDLVERQQLAASPAGPFADLLERTVALPGLKRLRFTTSNPHDFTQPLAELFRKYPEQLGRYIHLPVQAGNDEVLERMKRKVTVAEYRERVRWLRDIDPGMALSTDIIVGFPGETEAQFEDTLALLEEVRYSFVFAFKYSPRKGTAAARFRDQIPEEVKTARLARLNALQDGITTAMNLAEIGQTRQVLCHYESRKTPGHFYARTPEFRLVRIAADRNLVGEMLEVKIVDANKTALIGELL